MSTNSNLVATIWGQYLARPVEPSLFYDCLHYLFQYKLGANGRAAKEEDDLPS